MQFSLPLDVLCMSNLITNHLSKSWGKNLNRASKRLQSTMLLLQRYYILVSYVSGKLLYIAYTLSRAFKPGNQPSIHSDIETVCMIVNVPIMKIEIVKFSQLVLLLLNYNCLKL